MNGARAQVVSLFLAQNGVALPARRVLELAGEQLDRRAILRILRKSGVPARGVEPSREALSTLPLPMLLELRGEQLCVLEQVAEGAALVRTADERLERTSLKQLTSELACAFEPLAAAPSGPAFARSLAGGIVTLGRELALLGVTVVILAGLGLLTPWLTREAIAEALGERSESLLLPIVLALTAAGMLRAWLSWLRSRARIALEARVLRSAVPGVFRHMLALNYGEQERLTLADQLATLSSAELAARSVTALAVVPVVEGVTLLAYLAAIAIACPVEAGVLTPAIVLTVAVAYGLAQLRARADGDAVGASAETRARLHDLVQGIATVKAEHAEGPVMLRWLQSLLRERGLFLKRDTRAGWFELWLSFSQRALRLFVLCYGARETLEGRMALPQFLYLGLLLEGLLGSLESGCRLLEAALSMRLHARRVDALLGARKDEPQRDCAAAAEVEAERPAIHMSDVWFRHGPDQPWILQGYDLTVARGEHLVLRGPSGSGKTTILRLIAGLYRPERGTVSVCGRDPARDRSAVCYLPQQAQLFAGSLRDNLEQLSGAPLPNIVQAAQRTAISHWLSALPMGIETVVAAQGANLSGGQRQWLLMTAAVASARPVVLLDEALSQVDHIVRKHLRLDALFAERTTVSVAHD
jgi:ABC-type bacteriocin/lantibiotic exporter with double-glycine peptidase domain